MNSLCYGIATQRHYAAVVSKVKIHYIYAMQMIILGSGTSNGVPSIACKCNTCTSTNPKDKRNRASAYIISDTDKRYLVDCGQEFRIQALENNIDKINSVFLTHAHADHIFGIDDLRSFSCDISHSPKAKTSEKALRPPIPIYSNKWTLDYIKYAFGYMFTPPKEGGGHAKLDLITIQDFETIQLEKKLTATSIPLMHGHVKTSGWLFTKHKDDGSKASIAYLTDCSHISDETCSYLANNTGTLEHLIIDGLRINEHSTHFSFLQAMDAAQKICPKHTWITHIAHNSTHEEITQYLAQNLPSFPLLEKNCESVLPAYDGLKISI